MLRLLNQNGNEFLGCEITFEIWHKVHFIKIIMNALVSKQTVLLDWGQNETQKFAFP